ncbi:myeloid leukemia factor 2-like isoform X2 [Gigantopelta aegis]|uniref:myeloid leukemia factor 2-like isoform X2 n=1 Tax=Gigantopelta aegis TaxID=1735272 RepID=UPI001B889F02|nr:myeloid leukemia factor 2-like isoform X2 [Gigantopelta aegis]
MDANEFEQNSINNHHRHMQHMQTMMLDPFGMANNMLGFGDMNRQPQPQPQHEERQVARIQRRPMDPFGSLFENMFMNTRRMMDDMHRAFEQVDTTAHPNGNANVFSQSSFMSYSNTNGQPRIYQASSSTRQAPDGVKEVRKTVRDSESGLEKMAIGHHIGDRGHMIERSRNRRTGESEENQEFINLEEEEARTFDREWQERTHRLNRGGLEHGRGPRHNPLASQRRSTPAIMERHRNSSHRDRE